MLQGMGRLHKNKDRADSLRAYRAQHGALVTMSGQIICGVGLDRTTGLFHRIDPLLHACVPADPPREKNVQDAMNFLFDEWLVDVALDPIGKSIAIMLGANTSRTCAIAGATSFFVTAGQRGGGKTTLVHMITLAVLGRKAAAARSRLKVLDQLTFAS
jgi:hypothetical protein